MARVLPSSCAIAGVRVCIGSWTRVWACALAFACPGVWGCAEAEDAMEASSPAPDRPPHLVLIVADTLRRDYLGLHGFEGPISPALDRFAREAVVFEDAIAAAPWTKPSMVSMMTALPPERHGLISEASTDGDGSQTQVLRPDVPVLAAALRHAGYRTVALYANPWLKPGSGLDRGFDQYVFVRRPGDRISEQAVQMLARADAPLFLYLHYLDPHGPYRCAVEDERLLADSASLGDDRALATGEDRQLGYLRQTQLRQTRLHPTRLPDPEGAGKEAAPGEDAPATSEDDPPVRGAGFYRRCYAAGIRAFDAILAPVLARVSSPPRSQDTLVLFTSDHGEGLGEHPASPVNRKGWEHGWSLHHHQLRVPMLIRLPGGEHGGRRIRGVVSGLDVAPTLLDLAGVRPWPAAEGRSLRPLLEGDEAPPRTLFASGVKGRPGWIAVRDGPYKLLIATDSNAVALYDLAQDPGETRDLAERLPERTSQMRSLARERLLALLATPEPRVETRPTDPETLEQLRALGYVEEDAGDP